jgi:hypothetical protein
MLTKQELKVRIAELNNQVTEVENLIAELYPIGAEVNFKDSLGLHCDGFVKDAGHNFKWMTVYNKTTGFSEEIRIENIIDI